MCLTHPAVPTKGDSSFRRALSVMPLCLGLARFMYIYTVYDRIFGDFPAKKRVYTVYVYSPGQP